MNVCHVAKDDDLEATILLPPSLFDTITDRTDVGLFFALYNRTPLFPIRNRSNMDGAVAGRNTIVGSRVIAATVGPGLSFSNLHPRVEITLGIRLEGDNVSLTFILHVQTYFFELNIFILGVTWF